MKKATNTVKLTAAQKKVLDNAKAEINYARSCDDVYDFAIANYATILNGTATAEEKAELRARQQERCSAQVVENLTRNWENRKNSIVWVRANSNTLLKLEALGLIEIIELMSGAYGFDTIRILNY